MFNPVVGMIYNTKLNRWHPVVFYEAPLPGPPSEGKPVRHRSKGHHTDGFETRELAIEEANKIAAAIEKEGTAVSLELTKDFPWDGEGVPAMVIFFGRQSEFNPKELR